jgi:hypothetical protein
LEGKKRRPGEREGGTEDIRRREGRQIFELLPKCIRNGPSSKS